MSEIERTCRHCGQPLVRRHVSETRGAFERRQFCGTGCSSAFTRGKKRPRRPPGSPKAAHDEPKRRPGAKTAWGMLREHDAIEQAVPSHVRSALSALVGATLRQARSLERFDGLVYSAGTRWYVRERQADRLGCVRVGDPDEVVVLMRLEWLVLPDRSHDLTPP